HLNLLDWLHPGKTPEGIDSESPRGASAFGFGLESVTEEIMPHFASRAGETRPLMPRRTRPAPIRLCFDKFAQATYEMECRGGRFGREPRWTALRLRARASEARRLDSSRRGEPLAR